MSQIAVTVDPECNADPARVNAWVQAVDAQAFEFCKAWGVEYTPVVLYSSDVLSKLDGDELAAFVKDARLLTIQASLDVPGALGYHDDIAGVIFARVMYQGEATSITLSHEALEEIGDPTCDLYLPFSGGREQAGEACDRVEGDSYAQDGVPVSNYLLLSAFQPDSAGPWDRCGTLTTWDGLSGGGYAIVRDADGNDLPNVFAQTDHALANAEAKRAKVGGRANRRLAAASMREYAADLAAHPEKRAAVVQEAAEALAVLEAAKSDPELRGRVKAALDGMAGKSPAEQRKAVKRARRRA